MHQLNCLCSSLHGQPLNKTAVSTNSPSEQLHTQHRPPNAYWEQPLPKLPTITRRPKELSFTNVQFKAQLWTRLLNDSKHFGHLRCVPNNCPIIEIPCMKKELAVVSDRMNKWVQYKGKKKRSQGSPCCTPVADHIWSSPRYNLAAWPYKYSTHKEIDGHLFLTSRSNADLSTRLKAFEKSTVSMARDPS